jgi:hypothetical protein
LAESIWLGDIKYANAASHIYRHVHGLSQYEAIYKNRLKNKHKKIAALYKCSYFLTN